MRTVGALVVGTVSGAAAALVHTAWWWLALAVVASLVTVLWLPPLPGVGFAVGWCVAVARASLVRPEGDYLISANAPGWALLGFSLGLLLVAATAAVTGTRRAGDHGVGGTRT